jgi:WS/DGAT/MGAT family acyltransferase
VLDEAPDFSRVVDRVRHAMAMVPELHRRVEAAPLHPNVLRWVDDPDVDVRQHVHHVRVPHGGTLDTALEMARAAAATGFDRARPLWDFTLIDGLDDGRAVWCMKAHHVLTDGIGSVQLAAHLFDFEPDAPPPDTPPIDAAPSHGLVGELAEIVEHDVEGIIGLARRGVGAVVPAVLSVVRHPVDAVVGTVEVAKSIGRLVQPVSSQLSPLMRDRMMAGSFRTLDVDVQALKAATARHHGRLNDGFLAGITGGMRIYHEVHEADVAHLRVAMPISLRTEQHDAGGNHVTVMRFVVPVDITDAGCRIRELSHHVQRVREERSIEYTELVAGALNVMPKGVIGTMLKRVDFLASNVPGVPVPMWLAGAPVQRFYPFGPTAGSAVNITLMSYNGVCCIGINTDGAAIPDPDVFLDCLRQGFDEVLAA